MLNKQSIFIEVAYLTHQMFDDLVADDFESLFSKHDKRSELLGLILEDQNLLNENYDEFKVFCELNAKLTEQMMLMQEDTANQLTQYYKSQNIKNIYGI